MISFFLKLLLSKIVFYLDIISSNFWISKIKKQNRFGVLAYYVNLFQSCTMISIPDMRRRQANMWLRKC